MSSKKAEESERRRQEAIAARAELTRQRQNVVSAALQAVDSGNSANKRIVFDSDGDEDDEDGGRFDNKVGL